MAQLTRIERVFYSACALVLLWWVLFFGAWMLITPYPAAVRYP